MVETLKLIVKGYVQKVGYREEVEAIARELGITGYAKNLDDPKYVEIVAQHANEKVLVEFEQKIKIKKYPIEVREVKTELIGTKEIYQIFDVIHGSLDKEFGERMVEARRALDRVENKLDSMDKNLGNKLDKFSNGTQGRFDKLDVKYGTVSDKLASIDNHLKELVDIIKQAVPRQ